MRKLIEIKTQFPGIHRYAGASSATAFLRQPHRHLFYVEVQIEVRHNDREVEFFALKHFIEEEIQDCAMYQELLHYSEITAINSMSCEELAEIFYQKLKQEYGSTRWMRVKVSEDNENGAIVTD